MSFLNNQIQALYKLYKFNFKQSNKSKKSIYFLLAIKYFTDNYHINNVIPNYHLLIQVCLNINKMFFEKIKYSINNCKNKEIYKFNSNVNILKQEVKTKETTKSLSESKKKMNEIKKIAETKMKLKITKLEEIDSLILNKNL